MTREIFLLALMIVSTLTGLVTEAVKNWLTERGKNYYANALAGWVAIVLSLAVSAAYIILGGATLNLSMVVYIIALAFLGWLSAMLGYDKVVQAISQFAQYKD